MSRWAVVGGGMLGAKLALDIAERGHEVVLYEAADSLGGLASAWQLGDVTWDRHYHVTLASDTHTRALLRRLGLEDEMEWVETRTGTWSGDRIHSMSSTVDYIKYPELGLIDKARLAWTIMSANRTDDWRAMEQLSVEDWLTSKSGKKVFESFWLPLLKSKLGDSYRITSAAFIWATIQRLYAARSQGLKKELFGYVPGGYARILDVLHEILQERGVDVRTSSPVDEVASGPVVRVGSTVESFDEVVVTMAPPLAARVIEGLADEERLGFESIEYQGIVCASLLTDQPLGGYYLTYLYDEAPFTGIVEMSSFVDPAEFGGSTLVYLPKYCSPDDPLFSKSDEEIRESFLPALAAIYPGFDPGSVSAFRVSRVRAVFPISTIGYSRRVPGFATSVNGVWTVSSAHVVNGTLNVNDTLALTERALPRLLDGSEVAV